MEKITFISPREEEKRRGAKEGYAHASPWVGVWVGPTCLQTGPKPKAFLLGEQSSTNNGKVCLSEYVWMCVMMVGGTV